MKKVEPTTNKEVLDKFNKLSNSNKVEILLEALDYMPQDNGRSPEDCIIYAMGYVPFGYLNSNFKA